MNDNVMESYNRYLNDKRLKNIISYKKYSQEKLFKLVKEAILKGVGQHKNLKQYYYAEPIAIYLKVKTHEVKQVFHKMNLKGMISQAILWDIVDCMHTRLDYTDQIVFWEAKRYEVFLDAF